MGLPSVTSPAAQKKLSERLAVQRNKAWLTTYVSLFTSLLAFFILIISLVELEGSTPKRNFQKIVQHLYTSVLYEQKKRGATWLLVENTLSKGIKVTMDPDVFRGTSLFKPGDAQINPRFVPYLVEFAELLKSVQLEAFPARNKKLINQIEAEGYKMIVTIRVEGHTDSSVGELSDRYRNNVDLSTFRAYAIMEALRIYTSLPRRYFSISGYGSFHPILEDATDIKNRRVEIYLVPQVVPNNNSMAIGGIK